METLLLDNSPGQPSDGLRPEESFELFVLDQVELDDEEFRSQLGERARYLAHLVDEGVRDSANGSFWANRVREELDKPEFQREFDFIQGSLAKFMVQCMCENEMTAGFINNQPGLRDSLFGHSENDGHNHAARDHDHAEADAKKEKDKKKKRRNLSWF